MAIATFRIRQMACRHPRVEKIKASPGLPVRPGLAGRDTLAVTARLQRLLLGLCLILLLPGAGEAAVVDAPHLQAGGVSCGNCHSYSLWWQFSPSTTSPDRAGLVEALCATCHDGSGAAPHAITHSSAALGTLHRQDILPLSGWSRTCLDCHDPHFQEQLRNWAGDPNVPDTELFLVQGTVNALQNNGASLTYTVNAAKTKPAWADPATWASKSGPGRGLILVVSANGMENTFEVTAASENSQAPGTGSISVNGVIDPAAIGQGFGLIYGQLIKSQIAVDPDRDGVFATAAVKFFDGKGGFIDNDASDGITGLCQVCHGQTLHFLSDVAPDPHINVYGEANAPTLHCTICHNHNVAFGHGSDGGSGCSECHDNQKDNGDGTFTYSKHVEHLNLEIKCSACHDPINIRDAFGNVVLKDDAHVATTTVCADCHHDGTDLTPADGNNPPNVGDNLPNRDLQVLKNGWLAQSYSFPCNGCHDLPPSYASGTPKANSHLAHQNNGYTCDTCHYATTTDGVSLIGSGAASGSGAHTNNRYDLLAKPGLTLTYDPATRTCASVSVSCHGSTQPTWGESLDCTACHLAAADVDDFSTNQVLAKIDGAKWLSSGHGRPVAEHYDELSVGDGAGNPGAGLSCVYCHDQNVSHFSAANPMRLANFLPSSPNNVCWVCHKTGSAGYDPDPSDAVPAVNSLAADKVDSYHEFLPGAGGQFCWDCHDPHGDANLKMVHDQVAVKSDINTGNTVQLSAPVVFTERGNGSRGYAKSVAPFNGICNVCHTVLLRYGHAFHYTTSTGDGHGIDDPAGRKCTECHLHNGVIDQQSGIVHEKLAFSEGTCLNCHDTPQTGTHATRRAISPEFPALTETNGSGHGHFGRDLDFVDCRVCHDMTDHMSGQIVLIDGDWNVLYRGTNVNTLEAINTNEHQFDDISDFCMSCHDANGATRLPNPKDPFANGNAPPDVATKFKGSLNVAEVYGDIGMGSEGTGRMVLSHHPLSRDDQNKTGAKLECTNCHGAHSASAARKLANPQNTAAAWTGTMNTFCLSCHAGGSDPRNPGFPSGVTGPLKTWFNTPGTACDSDGNPATVEVFDCSDNCVLQADVTTFTGDNFCDDGYAYGPYIPMDLRCDAFTNDGGDCGSVVLNDGYSILAGVDQCTSYSQAPWHVDMSWGHSAHGGGTKRNWPGYAQVPQVPSYEMDCTACHDPHGSYTPTHRTGNPYLIKDIVDGTPFVDDGSRRLGSQVLQCTDPSASPPACYKGTKGSVVIYTPAHTGNVAAYNGWTGFCSKCHVNWYNATLSPGHRFGDTNSCLTCHAHGAKMGEDDYLDYNDATWCP